MHSCPQSPDSFASQRVKISAESAEAAAQMVEKIYSETNLLDFSNRDVTDISVFTRSVIPIPNRIQRKSLQSLPFGGGLSRVRYCFGSTVLIASDIPAEGNSIKVHLFESAIDLLSYATLQKMRLHKGIVPDFYQVINR